MLDKLIVYEYPLDKKKRYGLPYDGGYVIADINHDLLISCGISNDISFETDYLKQNNCKCFAYDGTIKSVPKNYRFSKSIRTKHSINSNSYLKFLINNKYLNKIIFKKNKRINFIKKNISPIESDTTTNLKKILSNNTNILLKMDIEGCENEWFKSLESHELNNISQIAIEIHWIDKDNFDWSIFDIINESFYLIHIHGNNFSQLKTIDNIQIPSVIECTYLNKRFFTNTPPLNTQDFPTNLDCSNNVKRADHVLKGYPFSNP